MGEKELERFEAQGAVFGGEAGEHSPVGGDEWHFEGLSQSEEISVVDGEVVLQAEGYGGDQNVQVEWNDGDPRPENSRRACDVSSADTRGEYRSAFANSINNISGAWSSSSARP